MAEFKARGFYTKPIGKILTQLGAHILTVVGGLFLLLLTDRPWSQSLGLIVYCIGILGLATNTHTSAHFASSNRRWLDLMLACLGFPLFSGVGVTYWWHKHNVLHHSSPNVIGVDDDIRLTPWFAYSQADILGSGRLGRAYYRMQWLALPLAVVSVGFQMQVYSFLHLHAVWKGKGRWSNYHRLDLTLLVLHWLIWVGLPMAFLPPANVLLFTGLRLVMMGALLFAVFAPGHFPAEAAVVQKESWGNDRVLLHTSNCLNFRTGFLGAWVCSGLQYQVEHHLFPGISHIHYPQMSSSVAKFCERNGYPYRTLGWWEALRKTAWNFVQPKEVTSRLERKPAPLGTGSRSASGG
jgi:fatty acid desaturase